MLDHSSSMGEGFAADTTQATFRDRHSEQQVKLDAARECVLIDLDRLPPKVPVSLFGFTSSATLLHEATADAHADFATALYRLQPTNGTDIAAALDNARLHAASLTPRPLVVRVLLVSDGLSDLDAATRAARACAQDGIAVDVVLIDPTDEGRRVAAAIAGATGGRWEPVFGADDLARATAQAGGAVAAQLQRTQEAISRDAAEAAAIRAETAGRDQVLFTVSHPDTITPGARAPLAVYVHRDSLQTELESRLAEFARRLASRHRRTDAPANSAIPTGTELEIHPVIPHVRCQPSHLPVTWNGELEEAHFDLEYVGDSERDTVCEGVVTVMTAQGLLLSRIPVLFAVTANQSTHPASNRSASTEMIRNVFGSYARVDSTIISHFRAAYHALGIHLFVDARDMEPGVRWWRYLQERIDSSDLFQLFWSPASASSDHVEREWRHALQTAARRPTQDAFILPIYWTPKPAPIPAPLAELNFRQVDLRQLGLSAPAADGSSTERMDGRRRRVDVRFPAIPLVGGPADTTVDRIQMLLRTVVPFVEDLTGLRYYPPTTYVVDNATVTSLRERSEPDTGTRHGVDDDPQPLHANEQPLVDEMEELLLVFHTSVNDAVDDGREFRHVWQEAEGGFARNLRRYIGGAAPNAPAGSQSELKRLATEDFPTYTRRYFAQLFRYTQEDLDSPNARRLDRTIRSHLGMRLGSGIARRLDRSMGRRYRDDTPIDDRYLRQLRSVSDEVLTIVDAIPTDPAPALLRVSAPASGVFLHHGSASVAGTAGLLYPATITAPAILVCAGTFDRLANALGAEGMPSGQARQTAESFLEATLVHEHTHAALATGIDGDGLAPTAAEGDRWRLGMGLNEALAAWAQRHYYRYDPPMFAECSRYIGAGRYPAWPYRGADTLEGIFQREGLNGIQRFIRLLRGAPDYAQSEFDALVPR